MGVMWIQMIVSLNTEGNDERPNNDKPIETIHKELKTPGETNTCK